jgi:hypothetical protein
MSKRIILISFFGLALILVLIASWIGIHKIINTDSTDCDLDSSKCNLPGGTWLKDKCSCSCNPGYSGVNCQTVIKHISDLEKCKDESNCASCLKEYISGKLSDSNASNVQQFKNDFNDNLIAINNICCKNNCSNTSGRDCDNCVKTNNKDAIYKIDDTVFLISNKGCVSYWTKNLDSTGAISHNIAKDNVCDNSSSPSTNILPKCNVDGGFIKGGEEGCKQVKKQSNIEDFTHTRWSVCPNLSTNNGDGNDHQCKAPLNSEWDAGFQTCLPDHLCLAPNDPIARKLYDTDKCNTYGWYEGNKCVCAGKTKDGVHNPGGFGGNHVNYYVGNNCDTHCDTDKDLPNGCPCGYNSHSCSPGSCTAPTRTDNPGRYCKE